MTNNISVDVRSARKVYDATSGTVVALDSVSVQIRKGEFFTLLGPSGCGKTTLLRLIAGFESPTAGEILLNGTDISGKPPFERPVNTVFQSYALFPHLTVRQNISFGLEMLGRSKEEVARKTEEVLELVKMAAMADRKPQQLSGGQQQRVALARALAPEPEVLLLDEPLSALDLKLRKEMQHELKRLQLETGITFIFVTHDQEEALTMSDRVAVMRDGRILQVGNPREIYTRPVDRFVADFIGETNFLSATIDGKKVRLATGDTIAASGVEAHAEGAAVTLAIRPEQVRVGDKGGLSATVAETVYFGTDTHLHLTLSDGSELVARLQSPPNGEIGLAPGATVSVSFTEDAVQVLEH
ncbi:MAG TPA: ABC transporter ATP-binding protein [Paracoccaceae bacterium]|nr:ABC transporter ATP-binding protein [Paracoccaceae bacterium]